MAVYSLLPVRHIGSLDLAAESGEEEELRLAVAPTFFVTVQTTTRKLQVVSLCSCPNRLIAVKGLVEGLLTSGLC